MRDRVRWVSTTRIGQLTGRPLLTDTGRWDVLGVDMGANTEHADGRLYIFFGDVAVEQDPNKLYSHGTPVFSGGNPVNSDLISWTDTRDLLHFGGHRALGWNFVLPNDRQGGSSQTGQGKWRFCTGCQGLFWTPDGIPVGACPAGGTHNPQGWIFYLPNDHQGRTAEGGQKDWRFCPGCHGLFWDEKIPQGDSARSTD